MTMAEHQMIELLQETKEELQDNGNRGDISIKKPRINTGNKIICFAEHL